MSARLEALEELATTARLFKLSWACMLADELVDRHPPFMLDFLEASYLAARQRLAFALTALRCEQPAAAPLSDRAATVQP